MLSANFRNSSLALALKIVVVGLIAETAVYDLVGSMDAWIDAQTFGLLVGGLATFSIIIIASSVKQESLAAESFYASEEPEKSFNPIPTLVPASLLLFTILYEMKEQFHGAILKGGWICVAMMVWIFLISVQHLKKVGS